jgi:MATE family multidrug resistance protein
LVRFSGFFESPVGAARIRYSAPMASIPSHMRGELRPMLSLALPVVLAELGWMGMGVVDTMMVGRVSAEAIGAVSIGRALFLTVGIVGVGLMLGLDTLVSTAYGAGRLADCQRWLLHGVYLSLALALPLIVVVRGAGRFLDRWGIDPAVLDSALPYIRAVSWSVIPLLLYTALRRYLQGVSRVRPVMVALTSANLVNLAGNWILVFGKLGAPALGAAGAGWSTCISSCYMALVLVIAVVLHDREERGGLRRLSLRLESARIRRLLELGFPAAGQLILEVAVFATATALAGRLHPTWLAAHQIALIAAGVTFMVPLGISSAGAVRVGQALGRRDRSGAELAGWTAIALGAGCMLAAAVVFLVLPRPLVRLFTSDSAVIGAGAALLAVAAFFQLFDGLQVVATGVLRGAGDTRTPLVWNLVGHWLLGLPVGYYLCFGRGLGAVGLWVGLLIGLTVIGVSLVIVWGRRARRGNLPLPAPTS